MAFDTGNLKEIFKDKRVLIGAAVIGGLAGLYVLSKSSGGGGAGLQPESPLAPQQPGTGDGGGGYDDSGIIGRLTQIEANQSGFQSQILAALQAAIDGVNGTIASVRGENQSALQSVIDQVNAQLSTQNQTVPDFSGFQSQLTAALAAVDTVPQRVKGTEGILKPIRTSPIPGGTFNPASLPTSPKTRGVLNSLQGALGGGASLPRTSYSTAIRQVTSKLSSGVKNLNPSYPGTNRGGGSSFTASVNRLSGIQVGAKNSIPGSLRSVMAPVLGLNRAPKLPTIKRGGNAYLK